MNDPTTWEMGGVVTLLQYLIGYPKIAPPLRSRINDNKAIARDLLDDIPAVFLEKKG